MRSSTTFEPTGCRKRSEERTEAVSGRVQRLVVVRLVQLRTPPMPLLAQELKIISVTIEVSQLLFGNFLFLVSLE